VTDVIAIIPARAGSKSILDKNISCLSRHPLIAYSIVAAQLSTEIDRVIVSTDSEQYAKIAIKYGAEVPFLRPREFATDSSTDHGFLVHAMKWCNENESQTAEYWVHLRPTTPLRDPVLINKAIKTIQQRKDATSLRSGHKAFESPFKWFRKDSSGFFRGLLAEDKNSESYNLPKEAFEDVYIPDGYVDVVRKSHVMSNDTIHGERMIGFESPVCTEVDSVEEFEYIQYQISKKGSPLIKYLDEYLLSEDK
jgi:CMP-N,N'-diacetyllegionaminic acid synthase